MQRSKNSRLATQGITAVLLFGIAFAACADQLQQRRVLPGAAPAPAATTALIPAKPNAPATASLPDLVFSNMTVDKTTYFDFAINSGVKSLVVNNVLLPVPSGTSRPSRDPCDRSFTFPLQLIVKNIGHADFVPKDSFQAVGVTIGTWNAGKDIIKLAPTAAQPMNFSVSLRPGKYMLNAVIDLHNEVAESRTDNNKLSWPLEVRCEVRADTVMALSPDIVVDGDGMSVGGVFVPFNNATPVSINRKPETNYGPRGGCKLPYKFQLKNIGSAPPSSLEVYVSAKSQNSGKSQQVGGLLQPIAPGASFTEDLEGYLELGSDNYNVSIDIRPKQAARSKKTYSVNIHASCGDTGIGGGVRKKPAPYIPVN